LGQIVSEFTNTAWSGTTPTTWNDRWNHYNILGNVTGQTDEMGLVVYQPESESFGTVIGSSQSDYRLTAKAYDPNSYLYYFGAKWYLSSVGRFVEREPLLNVISNGKGFSEALTLSPGCFNGYSFVGSNPAAFYDPSGLFRLWPGGSLWDFGKKAIINCVSSGVILSGLDHWLSPGGPSISGAACHCGSAILGAAIAGGLLAAGVGAMSSGCLSGAASGLADNWCTCRNSSPETFAAAAMAGCGGTYERSLWGIL
jgi:RHS repeat-associated protein